MTILTLSSIAESIRAHSDPTRTLVVGIDGLGGSGKSTVGRALGAAMAAAVIEGDDFYRLSAERGAPDFDRAEIGSSFDWLRIRDQVLAPAAAGQPVRYQRYDWDNDRLGTWVEIAAGTPIVVEGVYVTRPELRDLLSTRVWVETPRAIRLARGIERDGETARSQWEDEWMPEEDRYVDLLTPASNCEFVLDGSDSSEFDPATAVSVLSGPSSD